LDILRALCRLRELPLRHDLQQAEAILSAAVDVRCWVQTHHSGGGRRVDRLAVERGAEEQLLCGGRSNRGAADGEQRYGDIGAASSLVYRQCHGRSAKGEIPVPPGELDERIALPRWRHGSVNFNEQLDSQDGPLFTCPPADVTH
jgi:hypothetical protein